MTKRAKEGPPLGLPTRQRTRVRLDTSPRLRPGLKDHVERPGKRPSNLRKPAIANDLGELDLARLRAQAFAYFLVQ